MLPKIPDSSTSTYNTYQMYFAAPLTGCIYSVLSISSVEFRQYVKSFQSNNVVSSYGTEKLNSVKLQSTTSSSRVAFIPISISIFEVHASSSETRLAFLDKNARLKYYMPCFDVYDDHNILDRAKTAPIRIAIEQLARMALHLSIAVALYHYGHGSLIFFLD